MVYAPRIVKPEKPKAREQATLQKPTTRPSKVAHHHREPRVGGSPYTRWDSEKGVWVRRNFDELNGDLPAKNPKRIRRNGADGKIFIEVGQLWMEKTTKLVVVVRGIYPTIGKVFYAPKRAPNEHPRVVREDEFRKNFIPWDLVPD